MGWEEFKQSKEHRYEVETSKAMIALVWKTLEESFPDKKIKSVDSNLFHFIIYQAIEDMKKNGKPYPNLTRSWFIHGPYIRAVDDALIEMGTMDPKYHQMDGECGGELQDKMIIFEGK